MAPDLSAVLREPSLLGLGFLVFGALISGAALLRAALSDRSARGKPPREGGGPVPPAPSSRDLFPLVGEAADRRARELSGRLAAAEASAAAPPTAELAVLGGKVDGLGREVRGLAAAADAAREGAESRLRTAGRMEDLERAAGRLKDPSPDPDELLRAAGRARERFLELERALERAAGGWLARESRRLRRADRLARRVADWRRAWEVRLEGRKREAEGEVLAFRENLSELGGRWEKERAALAEESAAAARDGVLQEKRERFQEEAFGAWRKEKAVLEEQETRLREQAAVLARAAADLGARGAEEESRARESLEKLRREARELQDRWREELKGFLAEQERRREAARGEASAAQAAWSAEKSEKEKALALEREALEKREAEFRAGVQAFQAQAASEKAAIEARLSGLRARVSEGEKARAGLEAAVAAGRAEAARRVEEIRSWAWERYQRFQSLADRAKEEARAAQAAAEKERAAWEESMAGERRRFREEMDRLGAEAAVRRDGLAESRRKSEEAHASFVSVSRAHEAALLRATEQLEEATASLKSRAEDERRAHAGRLSRRGEKYEAAFARMRQKADQEKVRAEERLARERMDLESLRRRVERRGERVELLRRRRVESLERLFVLARESLDAALAAQRQGASVWADRLEALKARKAAWEETRARWAAAPALLKEAVRRKEEEAARAHEAEAAKLLEETQVYMASFRERSARHRRELEDALERLKASDADLVRQEEAFQRFLSAVEGHAAHLKGLAAVFKSVPAASALPATSVA